jgi:hypothetical protein
MVAPDRDRFFRQYFVGLRLTTQYADPDGNALTASPAMVSVSLGQNELVTGGYFWGTVARIEAFYPVPIHGDRASPLSSIYLFGSAFMKLSRANRTDPFLLNPAVNVQGSDPNVVLVTSPSNRDLYKIGVGVDLIKLLVPNKTPDKTTGTK